MTPQHSDDDGLLSTEQVAAIVGCSVRSVLRYVAAGRLPRPLKFGRYNRWLRSSINASLTA
jgi:predicted DNA-binding transcriptional regulator AlpA